MVQHGAGKTEHAALLCAYRSTDRVVSVSVCETCTMEEKIYICCARFPQTGEQKTMVLEGGAVKNVCPYLTREGICSIYSTRPNNCRKFFCDRFLLEEGTEGFNSDTPYNLIKALHDNE